MRIITVIVQKHWQRKSDSTLLKFGLDKDKGKTRGRKTKTSVDCQGQESERSASSNSVAGVFQQVTTRRRVEKTGCCTTVYRCSNACCRCAEWMRV